MEIGKSSKKSLHLPEEVIEEILSRLPVKSLLRLRCISKSWCSLIDSKRFIIAHHQNSIKNPCFPQKRVFIQKFEDDMYDVTDMFHWPVQCSLLSVLSDPTNTIPLSPFADPTGTIISTRYQILGFCNGLLCVLDTYSRIHLWNPSTRISKKLPEISNCARVRNLGFGWVESSGEYKVFVLVVIHDKIYNRKKVGKVYCSKTKSWKTIEFCNDLRSCWPRGLFAGGKIYWTNDNKEDINFLDLKSEVFGRIEMPFDREFCLKMLYYGLVGVVGGCLCVLYPNVYLDERGISVYERGVRVWVMKESWEKVVTLDHLLELLQPPLVHLNGEIFVDCGSAVLVYNARDNVFRFPEVCVDSHSHVYVKSLISPQDV